MLNGGTTKARLSLNLTITGTFPTKGAYCSSNGGLPVLVWVVGPQNARREDN
jgi:hypothetical protein